MFGLMRIKTHKKKMSSNGLDMKQAHGKHISNLIKSQEIGECALRKRQGEKTTALRLKYHSIIRQLQKTNDGLLDDLEAKISDKDTEIARLGDQVTMLTRQGAD